MKRTLSGLLVAVLCCFSFSSNAQTTLNLGDDSWRAVDLGFSIDYFGQSFEQITLYNNGMAMFGNNGQYVPNCCQGYRPTEDYHDYGLFPLWTDLVGGSITYETDNIDSFWVRWENQFEFYDQQTTNTFGINIKQTFDGAFIDFFYDEIDIRNHDVWSGLTGDISEGEVVENFFHHHGDGVLTGGFELDFSWNQSGYIDCSNPIDNPSCPGYEKAYTDQQCSLDPLYDPSCNGYEQAYTDQQCSVDPLYDPSCSGYQQAYTDQQCSYDPLYDPSCSGYQQAYLDQQCAEDPLYDKACPDYERAYTDFQCAIDSQYDVLCPGYEFFVEDTSSTFVDYSQPPKVEDGNSDEQFGPSPQFDEPDPNTTGAGESNFAMNGETDPNMGGTGDMGDPNQSFDNFSEPPPAPAYNEPEFREVFRDTFNDEPASGEPALVEDEPALEEFLREEREVAEEREEVPAVRIASEEATSEEFSEVVREETVAEKEESEKSETSTRQRGSRVGVSVGLSTASELVSSLISNSIESGQSSSSSNPTGGSSGGSTGGFSGFDDGSSGFDGGFGDIFGSDAQNFGQISQSGQDFTDFTNTMTTDTQETQQIDDSIALGGDINVGISVVPTVEQQNMQNNEQMIVEKPTLAQVLAEQVRKRNAENQTGIFGKQESVLTSIASATDFTKYYEERVSYAPSWYGAEQVYPGNRLPDRGRSYYNMFNENYGTMRTLIRSQY
mgnify:CR=1 FL=1